MNYKKILITLLSLFLLFFFCEELIRRKISGFAGSYPFVEYWEIQATEDELIKAIVKFKTKYQRFQPPNQKELYNPRTKEYDYDTKVMQDYLLKAIYDSTYTKPPLTDSISKDDSYWLYVDFYYKDDKEVVNCYTRPETKNLTTFALISFVPDNQVDEVLLINRDFWYVPNRFRIKKFETEIVNPIKEIIKKNRE